MDPMSSEQQTDPTLQRLWGHQQRPRRGPKPALSLGTIIETAFEIADADGLDAVSMSRIAEKLGCSAMALYRHVSSKDELLVLLTDRVAALLPPFPTHASWRAGLEAWTREQINLVLDHPWYLDLPLATAPPGPHRLRWFDAAMGVMAEVDLAFDEKVAVIGLLAQHVLGEAQVQVETQRAAIAHLRSSGAVDEDVPDADLDPAAVERANPYFDFETVLTRLATPDQFPHLFAAASTWSSESAEARPATRSDEIGFGLDIVLDGIEAYVRRRTRRTDGG
jgi:AcrR family transcriptional regulator